MDSSALKSAAKGISQGYSDSIDQWNAACNILDALGGALSLMSGDVVGAAIGVIGNITGIPTDYNGAVIAQATALIGGFDKNATPQKASGIYGNMPSTGTTFMKIRPMPTLPCWRRSISPFSMQNWRPSPLPALSVPGQGKPIRARRCRSDRQPFGREAVLVKALRQSYEKYQGAVAVSNYEYAFRQIEQARQYGQWLAANPMP